MGDKNIYSHSRISTFEQCPLKFKYGYIDKLETDIETTVEAFMGSRVHEALEKLYKDLKFEKLNSVEELVEFYGEQWDKNWNEKILIVRQEYDKDNYRKMGERFIREYYARYAPFDQGRTIGLEMRILVSAGDYQVQGYIDRLTSLGDGVYEIHDYKTSNSLPTQEDVDSDRQLALYSIAVREMYSDCKRVVLVWHYLAFDKELRSERTSEQLESLRSEVLQIIVDIESCTDFPAKESTLCQWCQFRPVCPKWKHLYELEGKKTEEFLEDDGVKLVNEYTALKVQIDELQAKLSEVSDRIYAFAERNRLDKVFGSDSKVTVWRRSCIKFPGKNEQGYEEIVAALKDAGLWESFSTLDKFRLEKSFDNLELDRKVMERIAKLGRREMIRRLYPGKA